MDGLPYGSNVAVDHGSALIIPNMIETIQLLRNLGQFDSVDAGRQIPINKIALVYAENGRGKTTLAAVLRSLGNGDPTPINERRRLGSTNPPHVVINGSGNTSALFQDGAWQRRLGSIMVFDDTFVSENICSGMKVETDHRQNLHELIIGSQGVVLNTALQAFVDRIEQHNRDLQQKGNAIPSALRGDLSVEAFCALEPRDGIEEAIQEAERNLAAGRQADEIQRYRLFASIPCQNSMSPRSRLCCHASLQPRVFRRTEGSGTPFENR